MKIIAIIAICLVVYLIFLFKLGRISFWRLAAKYPDDFYTFIKIKSYWFAGYKPSVRNVTGPFKLYVPFLGSTTNLYCEPDKLEGSQDEFRQLVKQRYG